VALLFSSSDLLSVVKIVEKRIKIWLGREWFRLVEESEK
jgi:hypothetical protein